MSRANAEQWGIIEDEDGVITIEEVTIPPAPTPALTTEVPESRLIVDSLIVRDFKSYAGDQALGPFNKNFTAVVGPNGSGKSNVIDSLLFVFGYRAKKIRSKKISSLIHKSDQYPNLSSCSVTVNFAYVKDEGDKGEIIADSRFSLSRTAFKDESSYYKLNGKKIQYRDVTKALRAYGIDLEHSRFLILQGEIEAISLMNPKALNEHETGLLEYVEDIIGTNRFIEPIKHFKEKVDELNNERKIMLAELKRVEKEKDTLEGPKNKAIEYLRLENKICHTENSLYHLKRFDTEKALEKAVQTKKKFIEEMKVFKAELENIDVSKKTAENSLSKITKEYTSLKNQIDEKKDDYAKLEREDASNIMSLKNYKEKVQKLTSSLENTKKEFSKLSKQSTVFEQETTELQVKKTKLEEEKKIDERKMDEVMDSLKQETDAMQEKKDKLEAELLKRKNKSYQIKSEMDLAQSELNILKSGEKKEKDKLESLITNYEKAVQSSETEEKLIKSEEEKLKMVEREIIEDQKKFEEAKITENSLTQQLKNERAKLEEAISSLSSNNHGPIVKALMKEKSKGRFTGVYGRLGDLGAIDEKYDVAISTACGRLDNIVTDTLNTAQECIEFLKQNNLGRTTFIALEKMKVYEPYVNSRISTPENVPRLFDLIRVKDKNVLPAFYFALQDTLVASDINQATRISFSGKKRYRVVALNGDICEVSGVMSGGGKARIKGRMGQTVAASNIVSSEHVNKIKSEVEVLGKKLTDTRNKRTFFEEQLTQKNSNLSSFQRSLKKRRMNFNAYGESVKVLSSQIKEQKQKIEKMVVDEKRVKELQTKIKDTSKAHTQAVEEESEVEQKVTKLQKEILQVSKGKFSKFKKNVTELEKKLSDITQALTKSNVSAKTAKRNLKKLEEKIKMIEEDIVRNKTEIDVFKDKQVALTVKGKEVLEKINEDEAKHGELKERMTELKKEIDVISEQEHKLKLEQIENKNKLKTYEANESEKRSIIRTINAQISKLKLTAVEDDPTELPSLSEEEISKLSATALQSDLDVAKVQLEGMKPDLSAINEFDVKLKLFEAKQKEVDELTAKRDLQSKRYDVLSNRRVSEFMKGFQIIARKLKEIYQMLTQGGDAEIDLVDSMDPFSKGLELSVRPPKKSWKYMRNLSGGEKTLTSLAIVFALHYYRPTPFYVMDEIDAALDVRNVAIVGYYLKETTKNTQFIIVSLRNVMNELSDHLLGIYKIENCTKNLSISYVTKWEESGINGTNHHASNRIQQPLKS